MNSLALALILVSAPAYSATTPSLALVAHNTTHRVEQLAGSNRIDPHFVDRVYSVQVEKLPKVNPADPAYRGVVMQFPDATGKSQIVEILLDDAAKAVSFKETAGPESRNAPAWPDADAITLAEHAMHYLLDNATKPELKPFAAGLASLVLQQVVDANRAISAKVNMQAKDSKDVLEVILKTDATVVSARVIKP